MLIVHEIKGALAVTPIIWFALNVKSVNAVAKVTKKERKELPLKFKSRH